MSRLLELAALGARETMLAQAMNSNNLANASTPGFRKDLMTYTGTTRVEGIQSGVDLGAGAVQGTGNTLDVAISGDGYFAIQTPEGGEAYSRRGDFRVDAQGQLKDGVGNPILGDGGPIALPPYSDLVIGADGTVSIRPLGEQSNALQAVDRLRLVNVGDQALEKGFDGYLRLPQGQTLDPDGAVKVVSGALESSNVNPVESMVRMIDLARKFESHVKMMSTDEKNRTSLNQIMRFS